MKKITTAFIAFLLIFGACFFSLQAQGQPALVHELIESTQSDSARIQVLVKLSKEYLFTNSEKSFDYALHALILAKKRKYAKGVVLANNCLGDFYWYASDFVSSAAYYSEGLNAAKQLNDSALIAAGYRNVGWSYFDTKQNIEALECFKKALKINTKLKFKKNLSANYGDLGLVYAELKLYDSAMVYHCKSIDIAEKLGRKYNLAAGYTHIAHIYRKIGAHRLAIDICKIAQKYAQESGSKKNLLGIYINLTSLYEDIKDYDIAIKYAKLSVSVARQIDDKNSINGCYKALSDLFVLQVKYDNALEYNLLCQSLSDSIYDETNNRLYEEMLKKNAMESKTIAIENLKKDKEITAQKLLHGKQIKLYLLGFGLFVLAFVLFLIRNNKKMESINLALEETSKQIKHKNQEIMDSIAYSKRIQDVCLPSEELRLQLFNNSFIFFRPKEVVSGDFYWYTEKNGKRFIACCDCSGHGVPGALMSMIGMNSLNRIVNEKGITSTDEILLALHREISKTLKHDEQTHITDAIDVAIVCFNSENEIEFAGANSPLWIVRNSTTASPQLIEIEPDKLSIGILNSSETIKYTKHTISLQADDFIYMFSDGVFDQMGGLENAKYGREGLKKLFIELAALAPTEQHAGITNEMNQWLATTEQVDDISIIGIKI